MTREEFEALQPGDKIISLFDGRIVGNYGEIVCVTDRVWIRWQQCENLHCYGFTESFWYNDIYKLTTDAVLGGQQPQPRPDDAVMGGNERCQ